MLSRDDLRTLSAERADHCVSLYLPTHQAGSETRQDPIRLKNVLREAEELLEERDLRPGDREELIEPARALLDDFTFWQHQSDGLAIFLSKGRMRTYRLPLTFEELAFVGERLHLKPLLPLLSGDGRFHILALSQNRVRLFEASRNAAREIDLRDIPESLRDAVGYDFEQRTLQFRTGTVSRGGGKRSALFHGHGAGAEKDKEEIEKFLRAVDEGVSQVLAGEQSPLVIAAVDYLIPIYRDVTRYPNLAAKHLEGNPDELDASDLHERCWPFVAPHFQEDRKKAEKWYRERAGSGLTSSRTAEVVVAAADGRVGTLFVPVREHCWGRFDPTTRQVEESDRRRNGDEDLLDRAAVETLLHGGRVFAIEPDQMPGSGPLAALFRH